MHPTISASAAPRPLPSSASRQYVFGAFTLDVAARRLWRDDEPVTLPSRAFDALAYLIENRDRLIDKEELISSVWHDVVVTDDSLIHAISVLRRTLSDDPSHAQFIETVPRRGYRFIGAVATGGDASTKSPSLPRPPEPIVAEPPAAVSIRKKPSGLGTLLTAGAVSVVVAVLATSIMLRSSGGGSDGKTSIRLFQPPPPGTSIASGGVLSPDGQHLAFAARDETTGKTALWIRVLHSSDVKRLPDTDGASKPFWSPDGRQIAFFANGRLRAADLIGESSRTITNVDSAAAGGTWGADDVILFADWADGLYSVRESSEGINAVTRLDRAARDIAHAWPQFLPDGRRFLYQIVSLDAARTGIYVGDIETSESIRLLATESPAVYAPPGYILHVQNGMLIAEELDLDRLALTGRSILLARGVSPPSLADGDIMSASRELVAFREGRREQNLAWFDRSGDKLGAILVPTVLFNPRLSPDEAYVLATGSLTSDPGLWLASLTRAEFRRLETDAIAPLWAPDGKQVAFTSRGGLDLIVRGIETDHATEPLISGSAVKIVNDWSPDEREIVYTQIGDNTSLDLWIASLEDLTAAPLLETPFNEMQARISPDGEWIAYTSDESGALEVYVDRYPELGEKRRLSRDGGGQPQWRSDQRELFFMSTDRALMSVEIGVGEHMPFGAPRALFRPPIGGGPEDARDYYAVAADGQKFLIDGAVEDTHRTPITIMVNWSAATSEPARISQPNESTSRALR